jgi:hypothetical protein
VRGETSQNEQMRSDHSRGEVWFNLLYFLGFREEKILRRESNLKFVSERPYIIIMPMASVDY